MNKFPSFLPDILDIWAASDDRILVDEPASLLSLQHLTFEMFMDVLGLGGGGGGVPLP